MYYSEMLIVGEDMRVGVNMGTLLPLNFTVNLKLFLLDDLFKNKDKRLADTKYDIWPLSIFCPLSSGILSPERAKKPQKG